MTCPAPRFDPGQCPARELPRLRRACRPCVAMQIHRSHSAAARISALLGVARLGVVVPASPRLCAIAQQRAAGRGNRNACRAQQAGLGMGDERHRHPCNGGRKTPLVVEALAKSPAQQPR